MQQKRTNSGKVKKIFVNNAALRWAETQNQIENGITRAVLRFLAVKADQFGCSFYALESMAHELGFCERSLRDRLKTLRAAGLVRKIRRTRRGLQVGSVYQLIAWPGRELIPQKGHPKLGRYVVEDMTSLSCWELNRHQMHSEPESDAALNQTIEKNLLTCREDQDAILDRCLEDLGRWATQKNRAGLLAARGTLFELLDEGYDLHRHVLPVLRDKAESRQRIPRLNSWRYFREAIADYAAAAGSHGPRAAAPTSGPRKQSSQAQQHDRARAVRGVLQNFSKRGPLGRSRGE